MRWNGIRRRMQDLGNRMQGWNQEIAWQQAPRPSAVCTTRGMRQCAWGKTTKYMQIVPFGESIKSSFL